MSYLDRTKSQLLKLKKKIIETGLFEKEKRIISATLIKIETNIKKKKNPSPSTAKLIK